MLQLLLIAVNQVDGKMREAAKCRVNVLVITGERARGLNNGKQQSSLAE